ncbi:50S ribosomal protein L6 [Planctomycetota bacterium]|nr:50S ribosomal protein L6 [Planctomycetota bacterium]
MSRLGNRPLSIPAGVSVAVSDDEVNVKGPKGELLLPVHPEIKITVADDNITVSRKSEVRIARSMHGTSRQLLQNMIVGVTEGFKKELEIIGVGYNAKVQGSKLILSIGFCHPVEFDKPEGVEVVCPENTKIVISGTDKQAVGQFAANIRAVRKPEPYKGKGIRYKDEVVRRKQAKSFGS